MRYWKLELTIFSDTIPPIGDIIIQNIHFLDE